MAYSDYEQWKTVPNTETPYLSIVVPAYNEEDRILPTLGAIASHVCEMGFAWELILSDDGSKDATARLIEELGFVNLRVLRAPQNQGKGSAVRRGMMAATGKFVLFDDADNSTPIEELPKLLKAVDGGGYDIAVGSRAANGGSEAHKSLLRRTLSGGFRFIVRTFFRIGVRDTQCGFKIFTSGAARRLHQAQTIEGFSFDLEILYLAAKFHYKVAEVPVTWIDAPGSKINARKEVIRFLRDLMRIKTNDLRGVYARA